MSLLRREDVLEAAGRVPEYVRRTPLLDVTESGASGGLFLKCEQLQRLGVFKASAVFNTLLAAREREELDADVDRVRAQGAAVHQVGTEYADAYDAAIEFGQSTGALFCHAYDQVEIAAGASTTAEEILAEQPAIDSIVLAVGTFAGVAVSAEHRARVVAVEPASMPTLHDLVARESVDIAVSGVAADSLRVRYIGDIALDVMQRTRPTSVLVSDKDVVLARERLCTEYRIAAEHGAAAALAGLTSGSYVPDADERVAVIVCGANTDPSTLVP